MMVFNQNKRGREFLHLIGMIVFWCAIKHSSIWVSMHNHAGYTVSQKAKEKNKIIEFLLGFFVTADLEFLPSQSGPISWKLTCALKEKETQQALKGRKSRNRRNSLYLHAPHNDSAFRSWGTETAASLTHRKWSSCSLWQECLIFLFSVYRCSWNHIFTQTIKRQNLFSQYDISPDFSCFRWVRIINHHQPLGWLWYRI